MSRVHRVHFVNNKERKMLEKEWIYCDEYWMNEEIEEMAR